MAKRKQPETSVDAYKSLDPVQLNQIYRDILRALTVLKEGTYEQIADFLMQPAAKIWKRMSDLQKMELVYRPGNKRPLKSNRLGYTWKLVGDESTAPVTEKSL